MPRPRWTTRRIMAAVAALGVTLGLAIPAARVARDRDRDHMHIWTVFDPTPPGPGWTVPPDGLPVARFEVMPAAPFWPRYWRGLAGRPWPGPAGCGMSGGRCDEVCSLDPDDATANRLPGPDGRHPNPLLRAASARALAAPDPPTLPPFSTPDGISF